MKTNLQWQKAYWWLLWEEGGEKKERLQKYVSR